MPLLHPAIAAVFVLTLTTTFAHADPPSISPPDDRISVAYLPPGLPAPMQSEKTTGLALVDYHFPPQVLSVGNRRISIHIDGRATVTPLYSALTIRFGSSDPYSLEARRLLEETFEQRAAMHADYREAAIEFALTELPTYLHAVWDQSEWSIGMKKRILFELWDECAENGSLAGAGDKARVILDAFIRWRVPQASTYAYTAEELAALNESRTSRTEFAPYRPALRVPGRTVALALTF